jgi:hypothetical protein
MSGQYDAERSRQERDKGIERVMRASAAFAAIAGAWIDNLPHGWIGTGEDICRIFCRNHPTLEPSHPNAWGGIIGAAVKRGTLQKTGKRKHMKKTTSHSRTTDEYVRV